jgi:hypothetical protein
MAEPELADIGEPVSELDQRLARIEGLLIEIKRLAQEREEQRTAREDRRYDQVQPLIGPALALEDFLLQMHGILRKQNQSAQEQAEAVQQLLTVLRRADRAATERAEHAKEVGERG